MPLVRWFWVVRLVSGLLLLTAAGAPLFGQDLLRISEFAAVNDGPLADEDGNFSDWIELHNAGTNTVNLVQVVFEMNAPLTNNDLTPGQNAALSNMANLASLTSTNARWIMSCGTGAGVTNSYQSGTGTVYPDRWAAAMEAWQRNYAMQFPNRTMWLAQPFNEPDWGWGQGSQQNLDDILGYLQTSTNFNGVRLGGGCTLDCSAATSWYNYIASRVSVRME